MRVPTRRHDFKGYRPDPNLTPAKHAELTAKLERLKKTVRPRLMKEVATLAEQGDFSENAGYQIAKGRLRGVNQAILELEEHLKRAILIQPAATDVAGLGHRITVEAGGKRKTYMLLGSSEADPTGNVISHNSPLGAALMGKRVGEEVSLTIAGREIVYIIISIE